ncbi:PEP-utilizing enzyme [Aromatoleum aromaticum]|uniref:PEP-utilizing enzyme n=1 Tax=Aromatoleum aromaticum TaxID=551760 RepID=UPI0018D27F7F|nr:PEP-utilizing enzyme [Aromatoleum aromaticum]
MKRLTQRGARASHAAVVARQLETVCLVGRENLVIDEDGSGVQLGGLTLRQGDRLTLDGNDGAGLRRRNAGAGARATRTRRAPQPAARDFALEAGMNVSRHARVRNRGL